MSDEFEDLLNPEKNPIRKGKTTLLPETFEGRKLIDEMPMLSEFLRPVGITFLAEVMGKQPIQIRKRLGRCPTVGHHEHQGKKQPVYDFMTAMAYLIEPKGNIEEWFANKNAASLPPYVNKMFWDSAHQRNRVMISSGDLWHTEDVLAMIGRIGLTIKEETQLWVENLPGRDLLTDEQYKSLTKAVYNLQDTIRESMLELPTVSNTTSMAETIRNELAEAGAMPDVLGE